MLQTGNVFFYSPPIAKKYPKKGDHFFLSWNRRLVGLEKLGFGVWGLGKKKVARSNWGLGFGFGFGVVVWNLVFFF